MPGHIKKTSGPDPDPSPWLAVNDEIKLKNKAKPYDPKKSVWVPDKNSGGYLEGLMESKDHSCPSSLQNNSQDQLDIVISDVSS